MFISRLNDGRLAFCCQRRIWAHAVVTSCGSDLIKSRVQYLRQLGVADRLGPDDDACDDAQEVRRGSGVSGDVSLAKHGARSAEVLQLTAGRKKHKRNFLHSYTKWKQIGT